MTLYTLPNMSDGIDQAITGTVTAVPVFIPMFLLFVYLVVLIGGMTSQRRRIGTADMPMWSTIAGLSTMMITLPLTLTSGIVNLLTLSIVITVTLISGIWLFLDRNKNEV